MSFPPSTRLAVPAAVTALAILVFAAVARLAPEVERGRLLPFFSDYEVARTRLLGLHFYADTSAGLADLVTVAALAGVAVALALVAALLIRQGSPDARAFITATAGAVFLAADDLLGAHETVGHNLGLLASLPIIDHPDDVVFGIYGLVVVAFAWRQRRLLDGAPRAPWLLFAVTGAIAVGHDLLPLHFGKAEEVAEAVAGLALLTGVVQVTALRLQMAPPHRARPFVGEATPLP